MGDYSQDPTWSKGGPVMPDTLVIFGEEYNNVAGIIAKDDNGTDQTYTKGGITPTGNINITAAGTTDVTNYATATVPQGQVSVYIGSGEFYTESNARKWRIRAGGGVDTLEDEGTPGFIADQTWVNSNYRNYNAIPTGTTVTPTESAQTIGGASTMLEGAVTVNAISSNYVGSGVTRRDPTDLTASGATVSAPSGYYENNASKTIPDASLGGTSISKTKADGKFTTKFSWPNATEGYFGQVLINTLNYVAQDSLVLENKTVTPTTSQQVVTPTVARDNYLESVTVNPIPSEYIIPSGTLSVTSNGQQDVTNYQYIDVNVSGGGAGLTVDTKTSTLASANSSISFIGLGGEPTSFAIVSASDLATGASPWKSASVVFDGTNLIGQTITNTSNAQVSYDDTGWSKTYSNGTLTVTGTGTNFQANTYKLVYTYGGGADTEDVQVGSGATSITFTGLEDEPAYFSCIFKSNFSSSSGYQRVITVVYDGTDTYGLAMGSGAVASTTAWSYSYSSGSLTITSQGTNNGGYFHQPGYYQLTYAIDNGGGNYQTKSVTYTPSTSEQTASITADNGYDALKKVNITVNAMPEMTLPNSASATSSGTSKATITPTSSVQYLNIPTGYNATAQYYTIGASGGGGSVSVATTTWQNTDSTATTHTFSSLSGTPKAAFLRCTTSLSRSSSSSNYYVADMRWTGTATAGNSFRRSNGTYANVTSGYSASVSGSSITFTTTGTSTTNPGSFYNGTYELVYVY